MSDSPARTYPSPRYANYVLSLLLLAYIFSFIDRLVMSQLVGPIREDFGISDFEFSLLHGTAFAVFYTVMGFPIGRMVDRYSRRHIITIGVLFWSLMTCLCGVARSFTTLFAARVGVGVGEAALSPAAYSLLSDYFRPERLGRATAIYAMGITIGGGVAYMVGGSVYTFFSEHPELDWPLFAGLQAWQQTFLAVGLPGFLIALLLLTVREPPRQGVAPGAQLPEPPPWSEVIAYLWARKRAYGGLILGVSGMSVIGYGTLAWYPEFLYRTYAMPKAEGGAAFGSIFMFAGTAGTFAGAWFAERLRAAGYIDANMRLVMLVALAAMLPAVIGPLLPKAEWALFLAVPMIFLHYTHFGVAMAALQVITPNQMRGVSSALMLFMTNILGLALGATLVAAATDFLFADDGALRYSLSLTAGLCYPIAALMIASGLAAYRRALQEQGEV